MVTQNLQALGTDHRVSGGLDQTFVAVDVVPVTPSDTADLPAHARAIRAQAAGTLRILTYNHHVRNTFIAAGELLPVYVKRVYATGTTATGIEALL